METRPHPFADLSPARVVAAVESLGFWLPGEPFTLNSYENRVFLVHDDERRRWVVKFYRPERWTDAQIREEHDFLAELAEAEVAVAAPWRDASGESLHRAEGFRFTLFPHLPGQAPELENPTHLATRYWPVAGWIVASARPMSTSPQRCIASSPPMPGPWTRRSACRATVISATCSAGTSTSPWSISMTA